MRQCLLRSAPSAEAPLFYDCKDQSGPCLPTCDHHVQDVISVSAMTPMPKIHFTSITTHYYILLHLSQSFSPVCLAESWITKCGSKLFYETLQEKKVVYVLPITSILGRLPVVLAGDSRNGCCNGTHHYNHDLASADSSRGPRDGCPMYFMNSWTLGWSCDP